MKYSLELLKADKKALQRIYLISIMAALFILMLSIRDFTQSESYITDSSGRITGIEWEDKADSERRLVLSIGEGESASEREVTIRRKQSSGNVNNNVSNENTKEAEREAEISRLITDVEFTNKRKVSLPGKLSDGTVLNWSVKDESGGDYLIIPIIYLVLILLVVKSSLDSRNVDGIIREEILKGLPRFNNQLLLLMNAGMILSDSFESICMSYSLVPEDKRSYFEKAMIEIADNNKSHRRSTALLLTEFASKYNVKEMMRIATILTENEKRGSNILESLEREGSFLWESRKIRASERGKALDAKMAYPLGLLLIILIIITIAPAFLAM